MNLDYEKEMLIPFIMEGQVVDTSDPDQMGRVRLWIPALDGENFDIEKLPWATYASPYFGFTVDYPAGGIPVKNTSQTAYGMWAIPKIGATVLVFCLNADPASRYFFASTARLHRNRSLPAGRNTDYNGKKGPFGDAGDDAGNLDPIQPAFNNLREQFDNKIDSSQATTRGMYERQVAQAKDGKDGNEGYSKNAGDPSYLDPQTFCIVTPGRHAMIIQDDPHFSRLRLKTAEGHQIIFDDANERIYVSTAKGKSWIELDQDGHVHVYGSESISMRTGKDFNIFADGSINLEAGKSVNIKADGGDIKLSTSNSFHLAATGSILQSSCGNFDINSEASIKITSSADLDINVDSSMKSTAKNIDMLAKSALIASGETVDLTASSTLGASAGTVDLNAASTFKASGGMMDLSGASSFTASGGTMDLNGGSALTQSAGVISTNASPAKTANKASKSKSAGAATSAACAVQAGGPTIVPGHEPWARPASTDKRGPNWKE